MIIVYGYGTEFKREGNVGSYVCPNCGHTADHTLCRQKNKATLFYIPVFSYTARRGVMCESCGMIHPLSKGEYGEQKKAAGQGIHE